MHAVDVVSGMLWALTRLTCQYVMGADTVAGLQVQYCRPSVAYPGFWLGKGMDVDSYTCDAVSVKCIIIVGQLICIHSVAKSQGARVPVPRSW